MPTPKPKTADARIAVRTAAERSKKMSPTRVPTMAPAAAPRSPPRGNRVPSRPGIRAWEGLSVPTPRWLRASVARSSTRDVIPAGSRLNLDRLLRSHLDPPVRHQPETRSSASDPCAGVWRVKADRFRRKGEQHGSGPDRSEGLWWRRRNDPVDHRGDLRHRWDRHADPWRRALRHRPHHHRTASWAGGREHLLLIDADVRSAATQWRDTSLPKDGRGVQIG